MTSHDPGPFYVQFNQLSGVNPHAKQISIPDWTPPSSGHAYGQVTEKSGSLRNLETGIGDLLTLFLPFWTSGTNFPSWQLFSKPTPSDIPVQVAGQQLSGYVGTATAGFAEEATQMTINYRTLSFNLFKLVFLDYNEDVSFSKIHSVPGSGPLFDLDAYLRGTTCIFTGRDGAYPGTFISATKKLNDKLRKEYRQA